MIHQLDHCFGSYSDQGGLLSTKVKNCILIFVFQQGADCCGTIVQQIGITLLLSFNVKHWQTMTLENRRAKERTGNQ